MLEETKLENCKKSQHPISMDLVFNMAGRSCFEQSPKLECFVSLGTPGSGMLLKNFNHYEVFILLH